MAKIIKHQLFYPHPPGVVWEYLTVPELMAQWLMPNNFEPVAGHQFQFHTKAKPDADFDGNFYCEVLEVVPFKKLSYSWKFGPGDGQLHNSIVNWTLNEKDNGTELLLVHRGFEGSEHILLFALMDEGWKKHINTILQLLNAKTDGTTQA